MRQVQLDPMTLSVRATGQSAMSCFGMAALYPVVALLTIDFAVTISLSVVTSSEIDYIINSNYEIKSDNNGVVP